MRHGDKINNLGRKKAHREALLSNLACQLIEHKRIVTTLAKAKALRIYVEPLITKSKQNTTQSVSDGYGVAGLQRAELKLCFEISCFLKNDLVGFLKI